MRVPSFGGKLPLLLTFLPFGLKAQTPFPGENVSTRAEAPAALANYLQKEGILNPAFRFSPADIGFAIDTAQPKSICCDALFMEVLRSHLSPDQLVAATALAAHRTPLDPDSGMAPQAVLYAPFSAGDFLFVLMENPAPGSRSASLVVLKNEEGHFSVVEQSPLCRTRRSAKDAYRK